MGEEGSSRYDCCLFMRRGARRQCVSRVTGSPCGEQRKSSLPDYIRASRGA